MKKFKNLIFIFILLMVLSSITFSETTEEQIDRLQNQINSLSGTEKIDLEVDLGNLYIDINPKKAIEILSSSLLESNNLDYDSGRIESHVYLGLAYLKFNDYESTMKHFQESYALSLEVNNMMGAGHSKNGYGLVWKSLNDYTKSLQSFQQALEYFITAEDKQGQAYAMSNIGSIYETLGNNDLALDNYLSSVKINEELDNLEEIASNYNNIGFLHSKLNNFEMAFDYYSKAIDIFEKLANKEGLSGTYTNLGNFFMKYEYYEEAYGFFLKAMDINLKIDNKNNLANSFSAIANIFEIKKDYENGIKYYENALDLYQEINDVEGSINVTNNIGTIENKRGNYEKALAFHLSAFEASKALKYNDGLKSSIYNVAMDYEALKQYPEALDYKSLYIELQKFLFSEDQNENITNAQIVYETEKKDDEIEKQGQEIETRKAKMKQQATIIIIAIFIIIIVTLLGAIIAKERKKSEKLLLNILPKKVADDLKKFGKTEPENFENCSVYFSDIVSFTSTSENLEPKYLISELNDIFTMFDGIIEKYGCERIKTIGDAYMAVSGMPVPNEKHAENMIDSSLDILEALKERGENTDINWRIRVGINSGKIVGGVVGVKKYLYDVFGDTINTASRMESNSEPMRLNISESTYELVKDKTDKYKFIERLPLEVKGKGLLKMYFVERI